MRNRREIRTTNAGRKNCRENKERFFCFALCFRLTWMKTRPRMRQLRLSRGTSCTLSERSGASFETILFPFRSLFSVFLRKSWKGTLAIVLFDSNSLERLTWLMKRWSANLWPTPYLCGFFVITHVHGQQTTRRIDRSPLLRHPTQFIPFYQYEDRQRETRIRFHLSSTSSRYSLINCSDYYYLFICWFLSGTYDS